MNAKESGFLLLTGKLGDPFRKTLTTAQMRLLGERINLLQEQDLDSELSQQHLQSMGIPEYLAVRVLECLEDKPLLEAYLRRAAKVNCTPVTRASDNYPAILKQKLGLEVPGCLWLKGDPDLLSFPAISLVGSREINPANQKFAREVGYQAAAQGYVLVSGNARGADIAAQNACLEAGGKVISIVADSLADHPQRENTLLISENDYDEGFSVYRALRRNRLIHCIGSITFVAQVGLLKGGTWDGTVRNLKNNWSPVFCFQDNSKAANALENLGAELISIDRLSSSFSSFHSAQQSFL